MKDRTTIALAGMSIVCLAMACRSSSRGKVDDDAERGAAKAAASPSPAEAPEEPKEREAPAFNLTAPGLIAEYKANEVRADGKYKGRRMIVAGKIASIKKDVLDKIYITLDSGKPFDIVHAQAFFDDEFAAKASQLNKGELIAVACVCEGLMMNVILKDCELLGEAKTSPSSFTAPPKPPRAGKRH